MSKNILVKFAGHKRGGFRILIDKMRKGDNKIWKAKEYPHSDI